MKVVTDYPVAYTSPDHIQPWGTARDNTTDLGFIAEIEAYFNNKKIKTLDIGCSGGQLTVDFFSRGHEAIGIEGSDYSVKNNRANWPLYYNKLLFTCDATKPYQLIDSNNNPVKLDLITAWEVVEHIHPDDLNIFFTNIVKHMHEESIFCASISTAPDVINNTVLHQSVFTEKYWKSSILCNYFKIDVFPFTNKVRAGGTGFHILAKKN